MTENNPEFQHKSIKSRMLSSQRITTLDLARIMAMLMMIQGHTLDALASPTELDLNNLPWSLWGYLRRYTAAIFLVVSGAVQVFANKRDETGRIRNDILKRRIKYAVLLVVVGYMFNCPVRYVFDFFYLDFQYWVPFFRVGILQVIGVSLGCVLILFLLTRNDKSLGISAFIISMTIIFSSAFILNIDWFKYLPEGLAAYLSFNHDSVFTLFPYMGFMFLGLSYGSILKHINPDKRTAFIFFTGAPLGIIFILLGFQLYNIYENHFLFHVVMKANPGIIFNQIGTVFLVLSFSAMVYTLTSKLSFYYAFFGKKALFIYIAHLLILYGTPWWESIGKVYAKHLSLEQSLFIALLVEVLSIGAAYFYEYSINKYKKAKKIYLYALYAFIVYFFVIGSLLTFLINKVL